MAYKLVPPGCHWHNAVDVAIRNFKAHFLSILAGVADDFPLKLWDKLLPQAKIATNQLHQTNTTPANSTFANMNGLFDYNKMPLAPMGCNVQVHKKVTPVAHGLAIQLIGILYLWPNMVSFLKWSEDQQLI